MTRGVVEKNHNYMFLPFYSIILIILTEFKSHIIYTILLSYFYLYIYSINKQIFHQNKNGFKQFEMTSLFVISPDIKF